MVKRNRFILDGFNCAVIPTEEIVKRFLAELTKITNMTRWKGPWAWSMDLPGKEPGISGAVVWHESIASLHHYANEETITLDVYSCKDYSIVAVQDLFQKYFQPAECHNCVPVTTGWKG